MFSYEKCECFADREKLGIQFWLWHLLAVWLGQIISPLSLSFHIRQLEVVINWMKKTTVVKQSLGSGVRLPTGKCWLWDFVAVWTEQSNLPVPQFLPFLHL